MKDQILEGHSEYVRLSNIAKKPIMLIELRDYNTNKLIDKCVIEANEEIIKAKEMFEELGYTITKNEETMYMFEEAGETTLFTYVKPNEFNNKYVHAIQDVVHLSVINAKSIKHVHVFLKLLPQYEFTHLFYFWPDSETMPTHSKWAIILDC